MNIASNEPTVSDVMGGDMPTPFTPAYRLTKPGRMLAFKDGFHASGDCGVRVWVWSDPSMFAEEAYDFTVEWDRDGRTAGLNMVCPRHDFPYQVGKKAREHFDKFMAKEGVNSVTNSDGIIREYAI